MTENESEKEAGLIAIMLQNRLMRTEQEVEAFDTALSAMPNQLDDQYLRQLYLVFDDACLDPPEMYGIIQYLKQFEIERTTRLSIQMLPQLLPHAREWCTLIHARIFLCEKCIELYQHEVHQLNAIHLQQVKDVLQQVCTDFAAINDGKPKLMKEGAAEMIWYIDTFVVSRAN